MSQALYRRCGCRDENRKQLARACPKLKTDPKHGSWTYYYSDGKDPRTGKRRQYTKGKFATRKAADKALTELKHRLGKGTYVKPSDRTLGEYALEWLPRRERSGKGLRETTVAGYEYYIRTDIEPSALGGMKLTDIRRYHISEFVAAQNEAGRGTVTVRRLVTLLGTIFASAVRDELISANPARDVDKPALHDGPVKVWEPDQVRVFLMRCAEHRLGALFEVAAQTGLRRGEITGLRWTDVDLVARKVVARRSRVTVNGRVIEQQTTKTRAGLRTVPLSEFAVATLLTWQLRQDEEREAAQEAWVGDGHVFTMEDGRALDPAYVTRLFQKLRKGSGEELPPISFHGLRHCHASLMLASGADIAVVSKLLGHASIAITADVYGHLIGTVASDAVNGAANLIRRTPEQGPSTMLTQPGVSVG